MLDLRMLRRLVVEPDDLRAVVLNVQTEALSDGMAVLARGRAADRDAVDLATLPGLRDIELGTHQQLVVTAWRSQWHWHGGATLRGVTFNGQPLPTFDDATEVETELGVFRLLGMSVRDRFPEVASEVTPVRGQDPNVWVVEGSRGTRFRLTDRGLRLETNGRADGSDAFHWAPVVTFTPSEAGTFALAGELVFNSGQAAERDDKRTMTYMIGVRRAGGDAAAGASPSGLLVTLAENGDLLSVPSAGDGIALDPDAVAALLASGEDFAAIDFSLGRDGTGSGAVTLSAPDQDAVTLLRREKHRLFNLAVRPREGVYVTAEGSRLMYGDQRLRLWGVAGSGGGQPDSADRLARLGFNAIRSWHPNGQGGRRSIFYDGDSGARGELRAVHEGDPIDAYLRYTAACKEAGLFVMCPLLIGRVPDDLLARDDSFVAGGPDWTQWQEAILRPAKPIKGRKLWLAFDERLLAAQKRHIENVMNLENPYTGRRFADEETIAIWEVHNEYQLVKSALEQGFGTWPDYFRLKLRDRWNAWLREAYRDESAVLAAWGKLEQGESWRDGKIALAPILEQKSQYPRARAADFVRFITELVGGYYQDLEAFARSQGTPGRGVAVVPFSYDTQFRPNIPWHYSAAGHADVANFGMYFWSLTSVLTRNPGLYVMDSKTLADKPTVIYETMSARPNPFRGELAFINAAFAAWQDWDAVFFHYFHGRYSGVDEATLAMAMPMATSSHFWSAVEFERDPSMLANMALAGQVFLQGSITPAPDPVVYELGRDAIFGYDHYAGPELAGEAFDQGAMLRFRPDADFAVRKARRTGGTAEASSTSSVAHGLRFEPDKGRLIIDTPTAKAYIGPTVERYRFDDGLVVGAFDTDWVSFAVVSTDGKPLVGDDPAQSVLVNAKRDGRNAGLDVDTSGVSPGGGFINPSELIKRTRARGAAPVVEDRVAFTLWLPFDAEGTFAGYDFATRQMFSEPLTGSRIEHDGRPLYVGRLTFDRRGAAADTPPMRDEPTAASVRLAEDQQRAAEQGAGVTRQSDLWSPVAGLKWGMTQADFDRVLRQAGWKVQRESAAGIITVFGIDLAGQGPAEVRAAFAGGRLVELRGSYRNAPVTVRLVDAHTAALGEPVSINLSENAFDISEAVWASRDDGGTLRVTLEATQGNASVTYRYGRD